MKNFTKVALIITLVLVILGSIFCAVGLGIGFRFSDFKEDVEAGEFSIGPIEDIPFIRYANKYNWDDDGEDWVHAESEDYDFSVEDIRKLDVDVYYGAVMIEENTDSQNIHVEVEYRKEDHKRQVETYADGKTLKIEETGTNHSYHNDSTRITIRIPEGMKEFDEVELKQAAGAVYVNIPLTAKEIDISVDAGECVVSEKLAADKKLTAMVNAGSIQLEELKAEKLELSAGVGELITDEVQADDIEIDCGVGSIETTVVGREKDYSYDIDCGVGNVEIGDASYSGLSSGREIKNPGNKKMEVDCSVGSIEVDFSE